MITPKSTYQYDALYRLTRATGREKASLQKPVSTGFMNYIPNPNTANNAMQEYHQTYKYDALGNMLELKNAGGTPWTRNFNYNTHNNYLLGHTGTNEYTYDAHGNITKMPHLPFMTWDYKDQLIGVGLSVCKNNYSSEENKPENCPDDCPDGNTGDEEKANCTKTQRAYYTYNAEGERVRKVVIKGNIKEERFYLGDYEHFTKTTSGAVNFTRESMHVSDDKKRIVLIERKDQDAPVIRYQYDDHLGSASLELNQEAHIITYEEYHPFGTTSYRSGKSETEASLKRYKYVGKERDEESGLYYYGARYYAAWICRFVSVDPLQFEYPYYAPYQYAGNKPITYIDLDGLEEAKPEKMNYKWSNASNNNVNLTIDSFTYTSQTSPELIYPRGNFIFDSKTKKYKGSESNNNKFAKLVIEDFETGKRQSYSFNDPVEDVKMILNNGQGEISVNY